MLRPTGVLLPAAKQLAVPGIWRMTPLRHLMQEWVLRQTFVSVVDGGIGNLAYDRQNGSNRSSRSPIPADTR
jgi:hypothetical protein